MICFDREVFSDSAERRDKLTPGRVKGQGVFETMLFQGADILCFDEHLNRLQKGLKQLQIPLPYKKREYRQIIKDLLSASGFKCARVRLMVWKDSRKIHEGIVVAPYSPAPLSKYKKGLSAEVSQRRLNTKDLLFDIKSIQYKKFFCAYQEALSRGFDEAILLNREGNVVESSRANIFFVKDGVLVTPHLRYGCLNGITRRMVLKVVRQKGMPCKATQVCVEDLLEADEVFCTNSLIGIMPLTSIDSVPINHGAMGPVTKKLLRDYKKL